MNEKKVIGYVGTRNLGQMREEDIRKLDVINIAFGHIRENETVWEEGAGKEKDLERIRRIHPEIKIILSIGGWSADGFSQAAMTEDTREKAAKSAAALVAAYKLDGIDIDWEYPCFALAGIAADMRDKENFTLFLRNCVRSWTPWEAAGCSPSPQGETLILPCIRTCRRRRNIWTMYN